MSVFKTGYDTTFGESLITTETTVELAKVLLSHGIYYLEDLSIISSANLKPLTVKIMSRDRLPIPFFYHPILFKTNDGEYLANDVRHFTKYNDVTGVTDIKNKVDYDFITSRFILNYIWIANENKSVLKNGLMFAGKIFSFWLSDSIARRYNLDPRDQLTLNILCHFFYQSLFVEEFVFDEMIKQKFAVCTANDLEVDLKTIYEVFDKVEELKNIHDFCKAVKETTNNIRLNDFNPVILYTITGTSWYGMNSKEMMAMALEHPPTWISLIYAATTEKSYRNSQLAKTVDRFNRRGAGEMFTKAYVEIIKQRLTVPAKTGLESLADF